MIRIVSYTSFNSFVVEDGSQDFLHKGIQKSILINNLLSNDPNCEVHLGISSVIIGIIEKFSLPPINTNNYTIQWPKSLLNSFFLVHAGLHLTVYILFIGISFLLPCNQCNCHNKFILIFIIALNSGHQIA